MATQENRKKGALLPLLYPVGSAIIFGLIPTFTNIIYSGGGTPSSITCIRTAFAAAVFFLLAKKENVSLRVSRKEWLVLFLASAFGIAGTNLLLCLSYQYISGGMATTLHFIYPIVCVLAEKLFFGEDMPRSTPVSLLLVILGITVFSLKELTVQWFGMALALCSGLSYTFYLILSAHSLLRNMNYHKMFFHISFISCFLSGMLWVQDGSLRMTAPAWGTLVLFALLASVAAPLLMQIGIRKVGLTAASMLSTLEPLTSVIADAVIWGKSFGISDMLGCFAVCAGISFLFRQDQT